MKFCLSNHWPQEPATPSTVFDLVGDYGYGLGKGKIAACYSAGTTKHIAGVCLLQFDHFSQVDMRRFFNQLRLDIPFFSPETNLFTEGFFNDPKVARATFPQWWPLVLRVIDDLEWSLRQRGIRPAVFFHDGSVAGHYLVGVASAAEMMKRWPAPTMKHILVLAIPTEPALLAIFDEMLAAYQSPRCWAAERAQF